MKVKDFTKEYDSFQKIPKGKPKDKEVKKKRDKPRKHRDKYYGG